MLKDYFEFLTNEQPVSLWQARFGYWYRASGLLIKNKTTSVGLIIILLLVVVAIFAPSCDR